MITYTVFLRILGGEWARYPLPNGQYETDDLALSLGLAATLKDAIKETMVVKVETMPIDACRANVICKTYELVELG